MVILDLGKEEPTALVEVLGWRVPHHELKTLSGEASGEAPEGGSWFPSFDGIAMPRKGPRFETSMAKYLATAP